MSNTRSNSKKWNWNPKKAPKSPSKKNSNTPINLGCNSLSQTPDKTVSRHHITLNYNTQKGILKFVVYGKNPIWVHEVEKDEIKVYRRGTKGK